MPNDSKQALSVRHQDQITMRQKHGLHRNSVRAHRNQIHLILQQPGYDKASQPSNAETFECAGTMQLIVNPSPLLYSLAGKL